MGRLRQSIANKSELERLRRRLAEAEETLNAIRAGDVDAIAVEGPNGRQIYTLQTPDRPYQAFAESMSEGAASLASDGTILFCNRALAEMVGQAQEKLVGALATNLVILEEKQRFQQLLALGRQNVARAETQFQRPDGSTLPVLISLKPILSEQSPGICLIATDLSDRKRAEEALKGSEARLQLQFERMPIGCVGWDADFKVQSWNPAAQAIFGFSEEEAVGRHPYEFLVPKESQPGVDKIFARLNQGDLVAHSVNENLTKDGRRIVCHWTNTPLRDSDGHIVGAVSMVEDITLRKLAENKLREQAALIDLAHDAILVNGMDNRVLFWNRGAEIIYGWTAEQALGQEVHQLLKTISPLPLTSIERAILEQGEWNGELVHSTRAGTSVTVASRWSLQRDEEGVPKAVLEVNRDVSERKRAEEQLKQSLYYARSLIEASLDPLVTISREGKITDVNDATVKVTGVERQDLIGSDFCDYFTEPDKARSGYQRVFAEESIRDYPLAIRHRSGTITDVLYNATVYRSPDGEVQGVFAAARDVTEQKRSQDEVKRAEARATAEREKFNTILDSVPPYVCLLTPDYHVAFANREFKQRFGEAPGLRCYEALFNRTEPCEICETYKVLGDGQPRRWEWSGPDGRTYDVYDFPFTDTDGSKLILEMGMDITERKRAEEDLRTLNQELERRVLNRTAQLQAANQELEAFSYSVSHDLRAPLRHISGFSKILSEEFGPQLPEDAQHHLQRIQDGTRRMGQLIDDLLNLSRVGRREVQRQVTSLENVVRQVVSDLQTECEGREIQWKIAPLPFAECDGALLKQVFQNLLSNALKFTRPRKQAVIEIGCEQEEGVPVIFVRDNGVGFNMKYASKLFGVFQRMHRAEDFEGTGVGLATVQRIVQKHGGRVWAEAEVDKGATFYFSLASVDKTQQVSAPQEEVVHELVGH